MLFRPQSVGNFTTVVASLPFSPSREKRCQVREAPREEEKGKLLRFMAYYWIEEVSLMCVCNGLATKRINWDARGNLNNLNWRFNFSQEEFLYSSVLFATKLDITFCIDFICNKKIIV